MKNTTCHLCPNTCEGWPRYDDKTNEQICLDCSLKQAVNRSLPKTNKFIDAITQTNDDDGSVYLSVFTDGLKYGQWYKEFNTNNIKQFVDFYLPHYLRDSSQE